MDEKKFYNEIVYPEVAAFCKSWKIPSVLAIWEKKRGGTDNLEEWESLLALDRAFNESPHWSLFENSLMRWRLSTSGFGNGYVVEKIISYDEIVRTAGNPLLRWMSSVGNWILLIWVVGFVVAGMIYDSGRLREAENFWIVFLLFTIIFFVGIASYESFKRNKMIRNIKICYKYR